MSGERQEIKEIKYASLLIYCSSIFVPCLYAHAAFSCVFLMLLFVLVHRTSHCVNFFFAYESLKYHFFEKKYLASAVESETRTESKLNVLEI